MKSFIATISVVAIGATTGFIVGINYDRTTPEVKMSAKQTMTFLQPTSPSPLKAKTILPKLMPLDLHQINKDSLLSTLLPSDILKWEQLQHQKLQDFIQNTNETFWCNGNSELSLKFDRTLAESCLGNYEGHMEYQLPGFNEAYYFKITLKITSLDREKSDNKITLSSNKFGSYSAGFSTELLGTNATRNLMSLLWRNFKGEQSVQASMLAFYIRPHLQIGATTHEDLFGLNENFKYQRIGSVTLTKVQ